MKPTTILATSILALTLGSMAQAATVVHVTGSTAFRKSSVVGIEKLFIAGPGGGNYVGAGTIAAPTGPVISAGKFKCTYEASSSTSGGEQGATYVILEGTIAGFGANNPVIFKCSWSGSTGGLITTKNAINITATNPKGWFSGTALTGGEASAVSDANCLQVASGTYTGDGDAQTNSDVTMADSLQTSAGISGLVPATNHSGVVGVIPFNYVVNNAVTGPVKFTGCASLAGTNTITYTAAVDTSTGAAATAAQITAVVGQALGGPSVARNVTINAINQGTSTITIASNNTSAANLAAQTYVGAVRAASSITNITFNQAQQLSAGGAFLSQFTGVLADTKPVYSIGRNFDSGTRLSQLAETGVGVFGNVQQVCPTIQGAAAYPIAFPNGGTASGNTSSNPTKFVTNMDLWAAESIYPAPYTKSYTLGNSGYNGGGALAGALSTPGWTTAGPTDDGTGAFPGAPLYDSNNLGTATGGWVIGYLGRNDAKAATAANVGANTAHRLTFNGFADWKGVVSATVGDTTDAGMGADGSVTNYDAAIQEGVYQLWETELLYKYSGASAATKSAADKLADQIYTVDAAAAGILSTTMNVSKAIEGGVIGHN